MAVKKKLEVGNGTSMSNTFETIEVKNEINVDTLVDTEEIEVCSLIPNVSYKDNRTNDMYEWNEIGSIEYMTVETLKNMWRNNKSYFKNFWLKPNDERVIKKFGLEKTYETYGFLLKSDNYTFDNIETIIDKIKDSPNELKYTFCNKIKCFISNNEITDIHVVKRLSDFFNIDLI